jgi:beta-glucosidase
MTFFWGAATAAYQIEGAASEGGRTPSIWDTFAKTPGKIHNADTGDIACDHFHRYEEDLDIMQWMGLNAYRFSISWSRVLPNGIGEVNESGIGFYNKIIDGLMERGITPFITLYHWDLPQVLQDQGGWNNRESAHWFQQYAKVCAERFGDRVKNWITINEPHCAAWFGNYRGWHAPGIKDLQTSVNVAHHLLLGHGLATKTIKEMVVNAKVGIAPGLTPVYPLTQSVADLAAAKFMDGYDIRWFLDPVYGRGYPEEVIERFTLLPPIEPGDMEVISTPTDFLGVNFYLKQTVKSDPASSFFGVEGVDTPGTPVTGMGWEINPEALTDLLVRIKEDYSPPEIFITENGSAWDDEIHDGEINDSKRVEYLDNHLKAFR